MANAARVHSAEKGKDQRSYTLIGFGGAGPSHACAIAEKLSMAETMIPRGAGVASALGMLSSPFAFDFTRSYMSPLGSLDLVRLNAMLAQIQEQGVALLRLAGVDVGQMTVVRACDMRYRGQVHQITIPIPERRPRPERNSGNRGDLRCRIRAAVPAPERRLLGGMHQLARAGTRPSTEAEAAGNHLRQVSGRGTKRREAGLFRPARFDDMRHLRSRTFARRLSHRRAGLH